MHGLRGVYCRQRQLQTVRVQHVDFWTRSLCVYMNMNIINIIESTDSMIIQISLARSRPLRVIAEWEWPGDYTQSLNSCRLTRGGRNSRNLRLDSCFCVIYKNGNVHVVCVSSRLISYREIIQYVDRPLPKSNICRCFEERQTKKEVESNPIVV